MLRVAVDIGGRARVVCEVARTSAEQARGLQGHLGLTDGTGMLFPFHPPRAATFHMGSVAFPIDLVFADASGVVGRIVHGARPGERSTWSHPVVGAVVEVPAGFCRKVGLTVGHVLRVAGRKLGAQTYNILRTLTEAGVEEGSLGAPRGPEDGSGPFDVHGDDPLVDGYYGKEPQRAPPDFGGGPPGMLSPPERWNDRTLPDQGPDAMNGDGTDWAGLGGDSAGWEQGMGYVAPLAGESDYPVRMNAQMNVDLPTMIPKVLAGALRAGVPWEPVVLNEKRERAIITPEVMGRWLHALGLGERERDMVFEAATTQQGLDALATAFIGEQQADTANISHLGDQNILVLTRRK